MRHSRIGRKRKNCCASFSVKKRILFVAEAVTLAHVGRPLALCQGLDRSEFDRFIACDNSHHHFAEGLGATCLPLHSISGNDFLLALARGAPVYDAKTLTGYVENDLELLQEVKPDLVIGDFRLSLSVSARLAGIPYAAICNAYWSPYYQPRYVVPSLPVSRILPIPLANLLFNLARPLAFALHAQPLNRVRRHFGLTSLGGDLRRTYTDADLVLYADVPELFPLRSPPANHKFLGPIIWSPSVELPEWWENLPDERPVVYVTLGSSGNEKLLPPMISALGAIDASFIVATAGGHKPGDSPRNVYFSAYLPGDLAAARSALVICNGGSPTSQQALMAGVPVLGIAGNLDQYLNMQAIMAIGAGELLRADRFDVKTFARKVAAMLASSEQRACASKVAGWFTAYPAKQRFAEFIREVN